MLALLHAMSLVLAGWAVWGGAFVGVGLLVSRTLGPRADDVSPWLAFWLGFAGVATTLQVWHFARPVDGAIRAIFLLVGAIGLTIGRRDVRRWVADIRLVPAVVAAAVLIWLADRAIAFGAATDSGFYHHVAVDWITTYPLVIGLGNLSTWQSLNNASFLYDALLDAGPFRGRVEHLANGLLVAAWSLHGCAAASRAWRGLALVSDRFILATLPMIVFVALGTEMTSLDNDLPAAALALATAAAAIHVGATRRDSRESWRVRAVFLLACATACCKLSMVVLAGGWAIAAMLLAALSRRERVSMPRVILPMLAIAWVTLGPWLARNVMMNGYPLCPSPAMAVDVSWRVPGDRLAIHRAGVSASAKFTIPEWLSRVAARQGLTRYSTWMRSAAASADDVTATNWIRPWLFTIPLWGPIEIVLPLAVAAGCVALRRRGCDTPRRWLLAVPVAALAFWFVTAPDPRFGWAVCWTTLGVVVAGRALSGRVVVIGALLLCVAPLAFKIVAEKVMLKRNPLANIPFVRPGADGGFHPRPTVDYIPWTSRHGVVVHRPSGPQPLIWSGPLPRLGWPGPDADLAYRVPGDVASGFVIRRSPTTQP